MRVIIACASAALAYLILLLGLAWGLAQVPTYSERELGAWNLRTAQLQQIQCSEPGSDTLAPPR